MARTLNPVTGLAQISKHQSPKAESSRVSPARLLAFEILRRVAEEDAYASVLLATRENDLEPRDRSLCNELTLGVLRRQLTLDHLITHYANRDATRLDNSVRIALRLGLYQLRFLSRIPASAAVNEAVKLVRHARVRSADTLVNAVLRRAVREADYDPAVQIKDSTEKLAVETSHPRWLLERWIRFLGQGEAESFARANNEVAPVSFRVVARNADPNEVIAKLKDGGAVVSPSSSVKDAWRISGGATVLREFVESGKVHIQDEASQLVSHVLAAQPDDKVLDLCAAPGGKTTLIDELTGSRALVVASDLHTHRLRTLMDLAGSQKATNIFAVALDGLDDLPFSEKAFDRVLVDAPCSGTGTLRRNPEIRWRLKPQDIDDLADRQKQLLMKAAHVVRPGGRLVYSTCSVEPEENEEVVAAFLKSHDSFTRANLPVDSSLITDSGAARTWPHRQGTDGFFMAAVIRTR